MSDSAGKAVFLSYASQDADAAQQICEALRAAGIEVWFDRNELVGGDAWDQKIRQQIRGCGLFIPILSRTTQARREAYFRLEWKIAEERTHLMAKGTPFLLPVCLDETSDREALVPDAFLAVQWTRLAGGATPPAFVERVQKLLSGEATAPVVNRAPPAMDAPSEPTDGRVAVLPFVNMSSDPEQEFFSDGLAEELLNLLAKIPGLRVTSRSSAFAFKGKNLEVAEIARRLNVAHLLEGSVRKSGNRLRIKAQLIEVRSDTPLWSEIYDRTLDDIFAVQDEIAAAVVAQMKIMLLGAAPKVRETNPRAYALFMQARQLQRQNTTSGAEHSVALFQQALALDPDYAAAWDGLAAGYITQVAHAIRPNFEGYQLARDMANKALAVDPDFAPAHARLGWIALGCDGDAVVAARHYGRALALEPANPEIIASAAGLTRYLGRMDHTVVLREFVTARDPLSASGHSNLGIAYRCAGRLDESIASYRTALSLGPGRASAKYGIGCGLLLKGASEAALTAMEEESSTLWRLIGLPLAYHALGRRDDVNAALASLIERHGNGSAYNIAYVLAFCGESDRAFEWLDKAVVHHDAGLMGIVTEPMFARLHADPRWPPFLRQIGRAPEQLAAITFEVKLPGL